MKDLDKFDMIFQAYEYEKGKRVTACVVTSMWCKVNRSNPTAEGKPKGLQEFFDSTEGNSIHA